MEFTCPHCDNNFAIENRNIEEMEQDGYVLDYECPHCKQTMDISVERIWTGDAIIIENETCDCCSKPHRKRNLHRRGSCFPFPMNATYNKLCSDCYGKTIYFEFDERLDAIASLGKDEIQKMQDTYKPGDTIRATIIQSPYYFSDTPRLLTVEKVDEYGRIWTVANNGTSIRLCYGYDAFEKELSNG